MEKFIPDFVKKFMGRNEDLDQPEKPEEGKVLNPLKAEHLKKGVKPIIACIGEPEHFYGSSGIEQEVFGNSSPNQNKNSNRNVNYYEDLKTLAEQNFKNAGEYSYVISPIDSSNKFSKTFRNCIGLVVVGIDKNTSENISFLSHQDPSYFLESNSKSDKFVNDLREQLQELKERCAERTIDAVIVGGNYFRDEDYMDKKFAKNYLASIKLLGKETKDIFGFEPVVIAGPKRVTGEDHIFYDSENRRLYITRPEVAKESTKSYLPSDIKDKEKKW